MTQASPTVAVDRVSFRWPNGPRDLLSDVSFQVSKSERVAIVGRSGVGKTTLLRLVAGLLSPSKGTVTVGCQTPPVPGAASILFQGYPCFDWLTAEQNVRFGKPTMATGECHALLSAVGLRSAANLYPPQLSGGMRQRLALARALAVCPTALLLDEPFSALDLISKGQVIRAILDNHAIADIALLTVLHHIDDIAAFATRVICLAGQPFQVADDFHIEGHDHAELQARCIRALLSASTDRDDATHEPGASR